jgi:hypothetical protein
VTIEALLVGVLAVLIGTAFTLAGYPLFLVLLPIWAFLYGLIVLGGSAADSLGGGVLVDVFSFGLGAVVGVFLAILAYAFWWAGVILLGATIGWLIGTGLLGAIGFNPGLLTMIVGFAAAAVLGVLFVMFKMPKVVVIVITSIAGAATAVAGVLIALNQVPVDSLKNGPLGAIESQGWLSVLAVALLGAIGIVVQMQLARNTEVQIWRGTLGGEA